MSKKKCLKGNLDELIIIFLKLALLLKFKLFSQEKLSASIKALKLVFWMKNGKISHSKACSTELFTQKKVWLRLIEVV